MDQSTYDVVIMGTGITESVLSGLLALDKKKVLHVDHNGFYGDSGASLNITTIWNKYHPGQEVPKELGANRDWNIDLIPKFIMSYGKLVKMIIKTKVSHYLNWKAVDGSYVYQYNEGGIFSKAGPKICKVPQNGSEALKSDLMSLFEKRRCQKFFKFAQKFNKKDKETYKKKNPFNKTFQVFTKEFGLEKNTNDFLGHAVALYTTNDFLILPAIQVIEKIQLYLESVGRFGDTPYIYPVYGLAGIPESFARKCAVMGGTFMLNVKITKIQQEGEMKKVWGIYDGKENWVTTKQIIAHPSYMKGVGLEKKIKVIGVVRRSICILRGPIPKTGKRSSVQIIIPQNQVGRKNDIYLMSIGAEHGVCKKGFQLAIISTMKEHKDHLSDIKPALDIMGEIAYRFDSEEIMYGPSDPNVVDDIYITKSLDPTSHFESVAENVMALYKRITGKEVDLDITDKDME